MSSGHLVSACQRCASWYDVQHLLHVHARRKGGAYECCCVVCPKCEGALDEVLADIRSEYGDLEVIYKAF